MVNLAELKGKKLFYGNSYGLDCLPQSEHHVQFLQQIGASPALFAAAKALSGREKEALNACYEHKTAKEHAQERGISSRTVEYHLENAKNKLGVFTRDKLHECARLLKMAGLLDP